MFILAFDADAREVPRQVPVFRKLAVKTDADS
jgi:hypothetical protein